MTLEYIHGPEKEPETSTNATLSLEAAIVIVERRFVVAEFDALVVAAECVLHNGNERAELL